MLVNRALVGIQLRLFTWDNTGVSGSICLQSPFRSQQQPRLATVCMCVCESLCLKLHHHIVFSVLTTMVFPPVSLTSTVYRNIMPYQKIHSLAKLPRICPVLGSNIKWKIYFCQLTKVFVLNRKLSQPWSAFLTFHNRLYVLWHVVIRGPLPVKTGFPPTRLSRKRAKLFSDLLSAVFERLSYSRKCCRAKLFLEKSVLVCSSPWCLLSC